MEIALNRNLTIGVVIVVIIVAAGAWYMSRPSEEPDIIPPIEQTLIVAHEVDADTLDPQISGMIEAGIVFESMYDSLLVRDMEGTIQPHLAKSWSFSEDGKTLTLTLREDVTFHSGTPFNAEAVKYSFDRIFDNATGSGALATIQDIIKEVRVQGEYGVEIELYNPNILILDILTVTGDYCIDPTEAEKWGVDEFGLHPSGTGPFIFEEWVRDDYITVVKNPDYNWAPEFTGHEGPAKLDKIIFRVIPEPTIRVQACQTGEVHIAHTPSANMITDLESDPNVAIERVEGNRIRFLSLNTLDEHYPWNITEMRRAVLHAIDKEAIVEGATNGVDVPAYSPGSPILGEWYNDELESYSNYDPDLAASILEEQGWALAEDGWRYKDGVQLTINLVNSGKIYQIYSDICVIVQSTIEDVGIKVELEELDRDAWYTRTFDGTYDLTPASLGTGDITGLNWFFAPANIPWPNWMRVNDTDLMYNINMGMQQLSAEEAEPYFKDAQKIIVEEGYWFPLYYSTNMKLRHTSVEGFHHPVLSAGWIYIDVEIT